MTVLGMSVLEITGVRMNGLTRGLQAGVAALALVAAPVAAAASLGIVLAPAADAQRAPKPKPPAKEYAVPINEALTALKAQDFATALAKADQAAPHAKTPQEQLTVQQIRIPALAGVGGDRKPLLEAVKAALATGAATPEDSKRYKGALADLYRELGDEPNSIAALKAYVGEYGATAQQFAYLMNVSLRDKVYPDAISYGEKAMTQARAEGKVPEERWHQLFIRANMDSGNIPGYLNAIEAAYADHPKPEYLRAIAQQAEKAPKFSRTILGLDIFRALSANGVELSTRERIGMGEMAIQKALPIEAEAVLKALMDSGALAGLDATQQDAVKKLYAQAQAGARTERASGLATSEAESNKSAKGVTAVLTGEAFIGSGDYAKAISLIQAGLAKGGLSDGEAALAKLHLGIAQYKSGDKAAASATFADIQGDNGAAEISRLWKIAAKK